MCLFGLAVIAGTSCTALASSSILGFIVLSPPLSRMHLRPGRYRVGNNLHKARFFVSRIASCNDSTATIVPVHHELAEQVESHPKAACTPSLHVRFCAMEPKPFPQPDLGLCHWVQLCCVYYARRSARAVLFVATGAGAFGLHAPDLGAAADMENHVPALMLSGSSKAWWRPEHFDFGRVR